MRNRSTGLPIVHLVSDGDRHWSELSFRERCALMGDPAAPWDTKATILVDAQQSLTRALANGDADMLHDRLGQMSDLAQSWRILLESPDGGLDE